MKAGNDHKLAPTKKYTVWKDAKKNTKVMLLLKHDIRPFLSTAQRTVLMEEVGKQYTSAKKKEENDNHPKITMSVAAAQQAEGTLTMDSLIEGIKNGWIVVG
jgi:hypothetical protein